MVCCAPFRELTERKVALGAETWGLGLFCRGSVAWRTAVPLRFFCCFPAQGAGLRELFVAVMPSHGEHVDTNGLFVDGINESCSFVNASAPQTGEVAFEGFGLAGAGLGVHFEFFEQCHDFFNTFFCPDRFQ